MTQEEALRNILTLVDGSEEMEDVHVLQILLESIKTLAEKAWAGRLNIASISIGWLGTGIVLACVLQVNMKDRISAYQTTSRTLSGST
jgi:hypothetical protein